MTKEFWQAIDMEDHWEIYESDAKMILSALIKMEEENNDA